MSPFIKNCIRNRRVIDDDWVGRLLVLVGGEIVESSVQAGASNSRQVILLK